MITSLLITRLREALLQRGGLGFSLRNPLIYLGPIGLAHYQMKYGLLAYVLILYVAFALAFHWSATLSIHITLSALIVHDHRKRDELAEEAE